MTLIVVRPPVMPGLVPGIHVFNFGATKTWMAGTSPAMTMWEDQLGGVPLSLRTSPAR